MNPLIEEVIELIADRGWQESVPLVILAATRPLGLLYAFVGVTWAMGTARLMHMILAVALGFPMILVNLPVAEELIVEANVVKLGFIVITEIAIGVCLGWISSLPFLAMSGAGAITDQFRGESDSGLHPPTGGSISTFGLLYISIALVAFENNNGFGHMVRALYQSYIIWPIASTFPEFTRETVMATLGIMGQATLIMVRVTLPVLVLLAIIEFSVTIGARISKRYNFYNMAFPLKNLAVIAALPVIAMFIWMMSNTIIMPVFVEIDLIAFFIR